MNKHIYCIELFLRSSGRGQPVADWWVPAGGLLATAVGAGAPGRPRAPPGRGGGLFPAHAACKRLKLAGGRTRWRAAS